MEMIKLKKLRRGDKVAVVSPSFAAPARWPHVHELGLQRLADIFGLRPVEYPTTRKLGASVEEKSADLIAAFEDPEIKAVISSIGGDDQVTYVKNLPPGPFIKNPKPFFGYSDNTHLINHLWLNGVPSFFGGSIFTEFALQGEMDAYTADYLRLALFEGGRSEIQASETFNDEDLDWSDPALLSKRRRYQPNEGWHWQGTNSAAGVLWGGCLESIDELLRHDIRIPTLAQFERIVLFLETSEEIPSAEYVYRVIRALGERGILSRIKGLLVGRPKAWELSKQFSDEEKIAYKKQQREALFDVCKRYNPGLAVVQNMDFGHTAPQVCLPVGNVATIDVDSRKLFLEF